MLAYALDNHESEELHPQLNHPALYRGSDKDVYDLGALLLLVATDRLAAAGRVLGQEVPGKQMQMNTASALP
jgi:phosphoribosylaminoimidazole-succinocarboxamide synthase